jgi:hypothetical protein
MDRDLHGFILAFGTIKKLDLLSASVMKPRMDSIWATEYGEVETLEVKESTRIQHPTAKKIIDCIPIPLLIRVPSNSVDASAGNLRVGWSGKVG